MPVVERCYTGPSLILTHSQHSSNGVKVYLAGTGQCIYNWRRDDCIGLGVGGWATILEVVLTSGMRS